MVLGRQPKPMIIGMRRTALAACTLVGMCPWPITAHERWDDGSPVPEWVNRYCCGVADVHRLTVGQIHHVEGGWRADGYGRLVPDNRVMLSEDEPSSGKFRQHRRRSQKVGTRTAPPLGPLPGPLSRADAWLSRRCKP